MNDVGIVLAAGAATRFGSPKQLADFRGAPLVTWPVHALRAGGLTRVIVVLGAAAGRIAPSLLRSDAEIIVAEDWAEGLSASLRAGVGAAEAAMGTGHPMGRAVITLADQPMLDPGAISRVLEAAHADGAPPIVRATYDASPGHPVALSPETFAAVAALRGDAGARKLTGFRILDVPCDGLGSAIDIDTPTDLKRWGP